MATTYPAECRLTPGAQPRPSPIQGTGLFAVEQINQGDDDL